MDPTKTRKLLVADELRKSIKCSPLARHFASKHPEKVDPKRSPKYPALRELLVPESEGLSDCVVGELMESHLRDSIFAFRAPFPFRRRKGVIECTRFQEICLLLWSFTCEAPADTRRLRAIDEVLGGGFDVGSWRRAHGPEWEICLRLAEHLIEWAAAKELDDDIAA